ncbi:hypothetical protein Tco_0950451 [Tanacetum coccineum]
MDYSLIYTGYPSVLEGYTDASWINNTEDNSSTNGWVFLLGGGATSWASKKQTCITSSTMESKFVALASIGKEAESTLKFSDYHSLNDLLHLDGSQHCTNKTHKSSEYTSTQTDNIREVTPSKVLIP